MFAARMERKRTKSESRRLGEKERHLMKKRRKGELRLSFRKKIGARIREESRTVGGGRTLRSRGMKESRVAAEGLVMLADETRRGMEGYTCGRDD